MAALLLFEVNAGVEDEGSCAPRGSRVPRPNLALTSLTFLG